VSTAIKTLIVTLAVVLFGLLNAAHAGEWPGVAYTEIRAYAWPLEQNESTVILPALKVRRGTLKSSGGTLSAEQQGRLLKAQQRTATPRPQAACYVPHNAFVFYDAHGKAVAFMEICFDCLGVRVFPEDAGCDPDFIALAKIFAEKKLPFGRFKTFAEFQAATAPILGP
jgi:hypothetical protein